MSEWLQGLRRRAAPGASSCTCPPPLWLPYPPPPPCGLQTPQAPLASLPQGHLSGWPSTAALPLSPWPDLPWLSLPGASCCPLPSPRPLRPVPPPSQGSPHPLPVWPSHPSQSVILDLLVTHVTSYLVFTDVCTCVSVYLPFSKCL